MYDGTLCCFRVDSYEYSVWLLHPHNYRSLFHPDTKSHFCTSICFSGVVAPFSRTCLAPTTGGGYRAQLCSGEGLTDSGRRSARVVGSERSRSPGILPVARPACNACPVARPAYNACAQKHWRAKHEILFNTGGAIYVYFFPREHHGHVTG